MELAPNAAVHPPQHLEPQGVHEVCRQGRRVAATESFRDESLQERERDEDCATSSTLVYLPCSVCGAAVALADATKDVVKRLLICPACGP
jgi:hypothetical protein